jgi:hypothetical protein
VNDPNPKRGAGCDAPPCSLSSLTDEERHSELMAIWEDTNIKLKWAVRCGTTAIILGIVAVSLQELKSRHLLPYSMLGSPASSVPVSPESNRVTPPSR